MRGNKKTQNVAQASDNTEIITGDFKTSLRERFGKKSKAVKIVGICLVTALVIMGGLFVKHQLAEDKTALQIGDYKISQKQYNRLIGQAAQVGENRAKARQAIVDSLAARAAADKLKLPYSSDDASLDEAASARRGVELEYSASEYQRMVAYPIVINRSLAMATEGGVRVAIMEAHFSRYIVGFFGDLFGDSKLIGNLPAVESDFAHAKKTIDEAEKAINNKTKTPAEVIAALRQDKSLGNGQYNNPSRITFVNTEGEEQSIAGTSILYPDLRQQIKDASKNVGSLNRSEIHFNSSPSGYNISLPAIERPDGMQVGWRLIMVLDIYDKQPNIMDQFSKLVKEYKDV